MPRLARLSLLCLCGTLAILQAGCNAGPGRSLQQSQLRAKQLYEQNKALAMEREQAMQSAAALAAEKERLAQNLDVAQQRLDNLNAERSTLQQRYISLLNQAKNQPNPLDAQAQRRFEELARKYPEFEFDPRTGVSKFGADILFDSGSADLKPKGQELLREFAQIMNSGEAQRLNILIVGHTDDQPIAKRATVQRHPTNWHLSTNRANSVALTLSKSGLAENRMGVAGYSQHQPVVPNTDASARQKNRRVEIYVLAPDAVVAGWDPETSRQ